MSEYKAKIINFDEIESEFHRQQIEALVDPDVPVTQYDFGKGIEPAHRHPNGSGIVADTAKISRNVFVGEDCLISGNVVIMGHVIITDGSEVLGSVHINGSGKGITISEHSIIDENVIISGSYNFKSSFISGKCKYENSGKRYVNYSKVNRF